MTRVALLAIDPNDFAALTPAELRLFDYAIMRADQWQNIATIKAANPACKCLAYKNGPFTSDQATPGSNDIQQGVNWNDVNVAQPTWFLQGTNPTGRVAAADFPNSWFMDVGLLAYQNQWATNVIANLGTRGWDGVMIDDISDHLGAHIQGPQTLALYPTDAAWATAIKSFLDNVGPKLMNAGYLCVPNMSHNFVGGWQTAWTAWLASCSGAMKEFFVFDSGAPRITGNWTFDTDKFELTETDGKFMLPVTYSNMADTATMLYARASFLLCMDNVHASASIYDPAANGLDVVNAGWMQWLGAPLNHRYQNVNGVWQRDFKGGRVSVNSQATSAQITLIDGTTRQTLTSGTALIEVGDPKVPLTYATAMANYSLDDLRRMFWEVTLSGQQYNLAPYSGYLPPVDLPVQTYAQLRSKSLQDVEKAYWRYFLSGQIGAI